MGMADTTTYTADEIAAMFSPVTASHYERAIAEYAPTADRLTEFVDRVRAADDDELHRMTVSEFSGEAILNSRGGGDPSTWFKTDVLADECRRRDVADHAEGCPAIGNRHQRAYNETVKSFGHGTAATRPAACTCQESTPS